MSENTTVIEETTSQEEEQANAAAKPDEPIETSTVSTPETASKKPFLRFRAKNNSAFSRDEWILSNINSEDLMDYIRLEHERMELLQKSKDTRGRRLLTAFELTISLASITAITYLLKDNPTILISILYTIGIISVLWLWKKPNDKNGKN